MGRTQNGLKGSTEEVVAVCGVIGPPRSLVDLCDETQGIQPELGPHYFSIVMIVDNIPLTHQ